MAGFDPNTFDLKVQAAVNGIRDPEQQNNTKAYIAQLHNYSVSQNTSKNEVDFPGLCDEYIKAKLSNAVKKANSLTEEDAKAALLAETQETVLKDIERKTLDVESLTVTLTPDATWSQSARTHKGKYNELLEKHGGALPEPMAEIDKACREMIEENTQGWPAGKKDLALYSLLREELNDYDSRVELLNVDSSNNPEAAAEVKNKLSRMKKDCLLEGKAEAQSDLYALSNQLYDQPEARDAIRSRITEHAILKQLQPDIEHKSDSLGIGSVAYSKDTYKKEVEESLHKNSKHPYVYIVVPEEVPAKDENGNEITVGQDGKHLMETKPKVIMARLRGTAAKGETYVPENNRLPDCDSDILVFDPVDEHGRFITDGKPIKPMEARDMGKTIFDDAKQCKQALIEAYKDPDTFFNKETRTEMTIAQTPFKYDKQTDTCVRYPMATETCNPRALIKEHEEILLQRSYSSDPVKRAMENTNTKTKAELMAKFMGCDTKDLLKDSFMFNEAVTQNEPSKTLEEKAHFNFRGMAAPVQKLTALTEMATAVNLASNDMYLSQNSLSKDTTARKDDVKHILEARTIGTYAEASAAFDELIPDRISKYTDKERSDDPSLPYSRNELSETQMDQIAKFIDNASLMPVQPDNMNKFADMIGPDKMETLITAYAEYKIDHQMTRASYEACVADKMTKAEAEINNELYSNVEDHMAFVVSQFYENHTGKPIDKDVVMNDVRNLMDKKDPETGTSLSDSLRKLRNGHDATMQKMFDDFGISEKCPSDHSITIGYVTDAVMHNALCEETTPSVATLGVEATIYRNEHSAEMKEQAMDAVRAALNDKPTNYGDLIRNISQTKPTFAFTASHPEFEDINRGSIAEEKDLAATFTENLDFNEKKTILGKTKTYVNSNPEQQNNMQSKMQAAVQASKEQSKKNSTSEKTNEGPDY